ncbi:MAG: Flp pilus assembly protein, protease CpaA [uncultured archaeon A07HR60]|nr:MAG: Flp pilus assembly protein, protease CpaA [uncultured archaeon A07HR60]
MATTHQSLSDADPYFYAGVALNTRMIPGTEAANLARLVVIPVFAWAAWRDYRTRRIPSWVWQPLYAVGIGLLIWETGSKWPFTEPGDSVFLARVGVSLLVVVPLAVVFRRLGGFGGADAKALTALAVMYPTTPSYPAPVDSVIPTPTSPVAVFSLTILTNTVLLAACYPVVLGLMNAVSRRIKWLMFVARPVATDSITSRHGQLFNTPDEISRGELDLDALRMYLRWRGSSLSQLRRDPAVHRNPDSIGDTHPPTDGAIQSDLGRRIHGPAVRPDEPDADTPEFTESDDITTDGDTELRDPWGAEQFLAEIDQTAYGTTPETLRESLDVIVSRNTVWVSPGVPLVVPMFFGLLVALAYGDILFTLVSFL